MTRRYGSYSWLRPFFFFLIPDSVIETLASSPFNDFWPLQDWIPLRFLDSLGTYVSPIISDDNSIVHLQSIYIHELLILQSV